MKKVFDVHVKLQRQAETIEVIRNLTLNRNKPHMGLKGSNGLYASHEWWASIESGKMPTKLVAGVITRAYHAGQGDTGPDNMADILTHEGSIQSIGIEVNDPEDAKLFRVGQSVEVVYALDELKKRAPDGSPTYSKVTLSVSVSNPLSD